jgi:hypothetical protein
MKLPHEIAEQFAKFGRRGGKKRAAKLSARQRREIAKKAGKASGEARRKG